MQIHIGGIGLVEGWFDPRDESVGVQQKQMSRCLHSYCYRSLVVRFLLLGCEIEWPCWLRPCGIAGRLVRFDERMLKGQR